MAFLANSIRFVMIFGCLASLAWAQDLRGDSQYVVFVSQRDGVAELYLLDLQSRQVSQLTNTGRGHSAPALMRNGRGLVFGALEGSHYELFAASLTPTWRTRRPQLTGLQRLTINAADEISPSVSADGNWVAFASGDGIEVMSAGGAARQLLIPAAETARDYCPVLSPDGNQVAFISNRRNADEVWVFDRTTGALRQLTSGAYPVGGLNWSADGQRLVFTTNHTATKLSGIAVAEITTGSFRILSEQGDSNASFSPRGDRLLMTSWRDGDAELYLFDLNNRQATRLTHSAGVDDGAMFIPANQVFPRR